MLKVCIDTNVWISGLLFSGHPKALVDIALKRRRKIQVISSKAILIEIERNLTKKFDFKPRIAKRFCYRIAEVADLFEPPGEIKISTLSEADTLVVETAHLGRARYLVTGDDRLLDLNFSSAFHGASTNHLRRRASCSLRGRVY